MAGPASIEPTPIDVGAVAKPDFAVAPDPARLFADRAARFQALASGHPLEAYLRFLSGLARAQHHILSDLPEPKLPQEDALDRAFEFGMPPIDRARFDLDEAAHATLERLVATVADLPMPEQASAARRRIAEGDRAFRERLLVDVIETATSLETLAEHVFAAAALQVHFARLASRLDVARLQPVGVGACPACGGPPVASLVVGWSSAHGARYVACSLCGTLWNHVRIKCVACDATDKISYHALSEDGETLADSPSEAPAGRARKDEATAKAECCDTCGLYLKIFHHHLDPAMDPVADDVATLGLDLKVREAGWARAAFNPYLLGY